MAKPGCVFWARHRANDRACHRLQPLAEEPTYATPLLLADSGQPDSDMGTSSHSVENGIVPLSVGVGSNSAPACHHRLAWSARGNDGSSTEEAQGGWTTLTLPQPCELGGAAGACALLVRACSRPPAISLPCPDVCSRGPSCRLSW